MKRGQNPFDSPEDQEKWGEDNSPAPPPQRVGGGPHPTWDALGGTGKWVKRPQDIAELQRAISKQCPDADNQRFLVTWDCRCGAPASEHCAVFYLWEFLILCDLVVMLTAHGFECRVRRSQVCEEAPNMVRDLPRPKTASVALFEFLVRYGPDMWMQSPNGRPGDYSDLLVDGPKP